MKLPIAIFLSLTTATAVASQESERNIIRISTDNTDLILETGPNNRLYQTYLGPRLLNEEDHKNLSWHHYAGTDGAVSTRGWEAYSTSVSYTHLTLPTKA